MEIYWLWQPRIFLVYWCFVCLFYLVGVELLKEHPSRPGTDSGSSQKNLIVSDKCAQKGMSWKKILLEVLRAEQEYCVWNNKNYFFFLSASILLPYYGLIGTCEVGRQNASVGNIILLLVLSKLLELCDWVFKTTDLKLRIISAGVITAVRSECSAQAHLGEQHLNFFPCSVILSCLQIVGSSEP